MKTILEHAVLCACERFGRNGFEFNTAGFQQEMSRVTDSKPMVTGAQASAILRSIPGVEQTGHSHWKYESFAPRPTA